MGRVLLVCPERLGHGQPSGNGIRFFEVAQVLAGDGHRVTLLSPDGGTVPRAECDIATPANILRYSSKADCAFVQGHIANDFFAHGKRIPTVIDLYDPYIVENLHYYAVRGAEVFAHDHATMMRSLAGGDFFLCASEAQRLFYLGMLLTTGRLNPVALEKSPTLDHLIAVAPFGVQPPRTRGTAPEPNAVLFGGIYDWYDPILAIDGIAAARRTVPDITLTFTTHPNAEMPQGAASDAVAHVKKRGYGDFIRFEPWAPYEQRGAFFDRFELSILTFPPSIETDLAMRTRIYDFLWAGLPVVTSSAPGTDEVLARFDAGRVVPEHDAEAVGRELVSLLADAPRLRKMREGAARFVATNQWSDVLTPLRRFCAAPRIDETRRTFVTTPAVPEQPRPLLPRILRRLGLRR